MQRGTTRGARFSPTSGDGILRARRRAYGGGAVVGVKEPDPSSPDELDEAATDR